MKLDKERRKYKRFKYDTLISHDVSSDDVVHPGKMFNFSKGGLYFESDVGIHPGEELYVGLVTDADHSGNDAQLLLEIEVVWQKERRDSSFRYGYGGKFLSSYESFLKSREVTQYKRKTNVIGGFSGENDSRKHRRRQYNNSLIFTDTRQKHKGVVTNLCRGGAYIKANGIFSLGEQIKIAVAGSKTRKEGFVKGWIVRISQGGIGVSFERRSGLERRNDLDRRTGSERRRRRKEKLFHFKGGMSHR